ncbi:hypothetical protein H4R33_000983 [Dimargaris cristalligena]|uniref:C2H2-type domain-containing protein n=1 Tax=Dimargaris cristalligena TaxID=215637 RepID=A0A4Q0A1L6_9FUNG|nr:hypothetical protein H4R33_000983 [Dimargaris cristalligena]RKP39973.1 hypothetical protein BJ085DRAFT_41329 [Dimargaris cristalligena]|eukprot:RKP39973.1 hypothetical protein BJ085DRAFT_41329 [Dimargaris cristalligena]
MYLSWVSILASAYSSVYMVQAAPVTGSQQPPISQAVVLRTPSPRGYSRPSHSSHTPTHSDLNPVSSFDRILFNPDPIQSSYYQQSFDDEYSDSEDDTDFVQIPRMTGIPPADFPPLRRGSASFIAGGSSILKSALGFFSSRPCPPPLPLSTTSLTARRRLTEHSTSSHSSANDLDAFLDLVDFMKDSQPASFRTETTATTNGGGDGDGDGCFLARSRWEDLERAFDYHRKMAHMGSDQSLSTVPEQTDGTHTPLPCPDASIEAMNQEFTPTCSQNSGKLNSKPPQP